MASRHLARSIAMQSLYEWDFNMFARQHTVQAGQPQPAVVSEKDGNDATTYSEGIQDMVERNIEEFGPGLEDKAFVRNLVQGVLTNRPNIDNIIEKAAPEWPIQQVAIVDRNILRIGLYELLFGNHKEVPPKVAINEAIELAKTFGGENSGRFVNGVLGTVYREIGEPGKNDGPKKDLTPEELEQLPVEQKVGAIVYRKSPEGLMFALVHDVFGYWTLAKGSLQEGEDLEEAVTRKVKDEIGIGALNIHQQLGENQYVAQDPEKGKVRRRVTYFLTETPETELKLKISGGLDDCRWFPQTEIEGLTMYDDVRQFFKQAFELIK